MVINQIYDTHVRPTFLTVCIIDVELCMHLHMYKLGAEVFVLGNQDAPMII